MRRLSVVRRVPAYVFSGDPLVVNYTLENGRRWTAALALFMEDSLVPVDGAAPGTAISPRVFFPRVPGRDRARSALAGCQSPAGQVSVSATWIWARGRPSGWSSGRVTIPLSDEIVVYPKIGQLTRRWFQLQRQASENRMGKRHDRSSQQEEYHGLRDYRSGDSPRWIHWRTSARRGELMVKEFEQQNEQDLALLIDPWLPRTKVAPELRDAMEQAISFAATVCLETCRRQGRRLILGWTGATPEVCQGQASVKLLHELLEQLAVLRPATEGTLAELIDTLPATVAARLALDHRLHPAAQPGRGGGTLVAAGGHLVPQPAGPSHRAQCGAGRAVRTDSGCRIELAHPARAAVLDRRAGSAFQPGRRRRSVPSADGKAAAP